MELSCHQALLTYLSLSEVVSYRYEEAVEGSSWVITGQCRWWAGGQWVPASLELVMVGSRRSEVKDATLVVRYSLGSQQVVSGSSLAVETVRLFSVSWIWIIYHS